MYEQMSYGKQTMYRMFTPSWAIRERFLGIIFIRNLAGEEQGQDRAFQQNSRVEEMGRCL